MKIIKRLWLVLLPVGGFVFAILQVAQIPATAAVVQKYRWWSIPINFVWMMLGSALVLGGHYLLRKIPALRDWLTVDPKRFERPFWAWFRRRGIFASTLAITLFISPVIAALMFPVFAVGERRSWTYAVAANAIVSVATTATYLGLFDGAKNLLQSLFH